MEIVKDYILLGFPMTGNIRFESRRFESKDVFEILSFLTIKMIKDRLRMGKASNTNILTFSIGIG